ncbi:N-acetylmuramic acid 6-phosphate etherase, partial [Streptococcus pyogenes]
AIVMHLCSTTQQDARLRLKQNNGVIKQAINT